jgi:hypothetical protein
VETFFLVRVENDSCIHGKIDGGQKPHSYEDRLKSYQLLENEIGEMIK